METIEQLVELGNKMVKLKEEIAVMQDELTEKVKQMEQIECSTLPDMMESLGMAEFKLEDGSSISIKSIIKASLPSMSGINRAKDQQRDALIQRLTEGMAFLRSNGGDALIKNQITVEIPKGEDAKAKEAVGQIEALGLHAHQGESVHSSSLSAWVKEKLGNGEIPLSMMEVLGIYNGKKAVISKS